MTRWVLTVTAVAGALLIGGWLAGCWLAAAAVTRPDVMRSRHSDPVMVLSPPLVAVTAEGKLYHDPDCAFIHGPARHESVAEAIADGYTPCTRCLKRVAQ
jgi:hypothetical protein